jgi:SlyX protein
MTNPHDTSDITRRLVDLEVKASYAEDTLEALNQVVIRQQEQIDVLVREVRRLLDERRKGDDAAVPGEAPADERPPHY